MPRPTGASSRKPMGFKLYRGNWLEMTRLVDVPIRVTLPARMEAKARGMRTLDRATADRRATPIMIGRKTAVVTVFERTELTAAAEPRMIRVSEAGLRAPIDASQSP